MATIIKNRKNQENKPPIGPPTIGPPTIYIKQIKRITYRNKNKKRILRDLGLHRINQTVKIKNTIATHKMLNEIIDIVEISSSRAGINRPARFLRRSI